MKKYKIVFVALLLSSKLYSQQNNFVQLDGKKFMLNCVEFYPKVVNFYIQVNNSRAVTAFSDYRNVPFCEYLYESPVNRNILKAQFQMVKDLGFNCIRLCGLEMYPGPNGPMIGYPNNWSFNEPLNRGNYQNIYNVLDTVLVLAKEVDLKVIYLVIGGQGVKEANQVNVNIISEYLSNAAVRYSNNPTLLAYDLYNEPVTNDTSFWQTEAFNTTLQWYRAIRDSTPNQLVTIGIWGPPNLWKWDPGILPLDFLSFHYYSISDFNHQTTFKDAAPYFKWLGENISKPWIIGETGFPSDTVVHKYPNGDTIMNTNYWHASNYADTIKRLNATNGSSGLSWWMYQDMCHYNNYSKEAPENFFGLMTRRNNNGPAPYTQTSVTNLVVDGRKKLDSATFVDYNPGYSEPSSSMPPNYYNVWGYLTSTCEGNVTGPNGPLKDAYILGFKEIPIIDPNLQKVSYIYPTYTTFTEADGDFLLKTDHSEVPNLCGIYIGYPGMLNYRDWPGNINYDYHNVELHTLNLNYGNGINEFNDIIIRSHDTIIWNDPMSIPGNIIIEDSAQLTIKDTVYFNPFKKVVVKPMGKLIVDGGTLTSGCEDTLWMGVEIQGDPNRSQTSEYQGYVEVKDSATIENAIIGLHCVLNSYEPTGVETICYASGGIIIADTAFFKNNTTSIEIEDWNYWFAGYESEIIGCTFEHSDDFSSEVWIKYIKLSNVNNVNILANNFEGNTSIPYNFRGTGIEANDATFNFTNYLGSAPIGFNKFNNLSYGICCFNTDSYANPEISLTNFTDCWRAIYLGAVIDAKILGDTITYKSQSSESGEQSYGIYLDNCDGYQVEGNKLSSSSTNSGYYPENGIIINNSGGNANKIYRNTLAKIGTPINAQNINRGSGGTTGLQLLCNNIELCTTNDIVVTYEVADTCNGIKMNQGSYNPLNPLPAGNLFTKGGKMYKNYTNSSPNLIYYAHYNNDYITYESKEHYLIPRLVNLNPKISNQNTYITWDSANWVSNECRDLTGLSGDGKSKEGVEDLKTLINLLQPKIDSSAIALQQKMDHGNTNTLINRILISTPSNFQALYIDLRNYSPYLSEKVLLAIIKKQGFPTNMLLNLMLVNTHVAKTYWLMDALRLVQPPLSNGQLKQVENKINEFSEMENDRMKLSDLILQRDNALNNVEMFYAHDTLVSSNDSLISMLQVDPRLSSKYQLVNHYFAKKDTVKAEQLFNTIPLLYSLDYKAQSEHIKYKLLYDLKKQLYKEGKNFSMLNEQQQQLLLNELINPSLSLGEMQDLNALRHVKDVVIGKSGKSRGKSLSFQYEEPILVPIENQEKNLENSENTEYEDLLMEGLFDKVLMNENSLFLYPNPAYNEVNILYNAGTDESNITIEISDVTGRSIKTYAADNSDNILKINTQSFNKGIYYVVLVVDGKRQKVEKLVIQ